MDPVLYNQFYGWVVTVGGFALLFALFVIILLYEDSRSIKELRAKVEEHEKAIRPGPDEGKANQTLVNLLSSQNEQIRLEAACELRA